MTWLRRLFPPRWRRLADMADSYLATANHSAARGNHGLAACAFVTAALHYEEAATHAPARHRADLVATSLECASQAANECDAYRCNFKPPRPEPITTQ